MGAEAEKPSSKGTEMDQEKVDSNVARLRELAKTQRQEAIDGLLALEKQGRVGEDIVTTRKACTAVLEVRKPAAATRSVCRCPASSQLAAALQLCFACPHTCALPADYMQLLPAPPHFTLHKQHSDCCFLHVFIFLLLPCTAVA